MHHVTRHVTVVKKTDGRRKRMMRNNRHQCAAIPKYRDILCRGVAGQTAGWTLSSPVHHRMTLDLYDSVTLSVGNGFSDDLS